MATPIPRKTPIELQEIRKKKQRKRRLRQVLVLCAIFAGIFVALYLNDVLVKKKAPTLFGEAIDSVGGEGYPTTIPDGTIRNVLGVGKSLAVLKDSNLYLYNQMGKQTENLQQMTERSVMMSSGDRLIYYDVGGRNITLMSPTGKVYTKNVEDNILSAHLGRNGEVAVVTAPQNFVAQVGVYNNSGDVFYTRYFSEDLVSNVAISTKGNQLAVSTLDSLEGTLDFIIQLYPLDSEDGPLLIDLPDRMVVWMDYLQEDIIAVLTDRDYQLYNNSGVHLTSFSFPEDFELLEFRYFKNHMVLMGKDTDTREYVLFVLDGRANEKGSMVMEERPSDLAVGDKYLYLLNGNGILQCNYNLDVVNEYYLQGIERLAVIGDRVYLLTKTEIHILDDKVSEA